MAQKKEKKGENYNLYWAQPIEPEALLCLTAELANYVPWIISFHVSIYFFHSIKFIVNLWEIGVISMWKFKFIDEITQYSYKITNFSLFN